MDQMAPRDRDLEVDLECGRPLGHEDSSKNPLSGVKNQAKSLLAKVSGAFVDGSTKGEIREHLLPNPAVASVENGKLVTGNRLGGEEFVNDGGKKVGKEKRKKTSNKKAPKPPRPPRGPTLDASDQKLIREITEIAKLKRARIERMKALRKMKAAKASSSNNNIIATGLTVIFFLVILFQGLPSRGTTPVRLQGSPVAAGAAEGGLISVQFSGNPSASVTNRLDSGSPNLVEQVAGSDSHESLSRFAE